MDPYDPYPPVRRRRRGRERYDLEFDREPEGFGRLAHPFAPTPVPGGPHDPDSGPAGLLGDPLDDEPIRRPRPTADTGLPDEPASSTWPDAVHGPEPVPRWVVTDLTAVDIELGVLKTGKEADVHLVERAVPGGGSCLLAAKRYRTSDHRLFHRDAGYLEGRRVRRSRENRAMARRTAFGRDLLAGQWAGAEFAALSRLWELGRGGGVRVPYPVQWRGTEVMLEFIGGPDGAAAPRLAQLRPAGRELAELWEDCLDVLITLAAEGLAHGDLSPYNLLVHEGRLVLIDLPQVVDVVANPRGPEFLARDVSVMVTWFAARGLTMDAGTVTDDVMRAARLR
ncbi:MAG TPA: RIO1 family regulatory kinase/ATPase [Kineosporiaceae bacterium]